MKNLVKIFVIILMIILNFSCKKKEAAILVPSVTTSTVTDVLYITATSGGSVPDDGGAYVTVKGVCWGPDTMPTIGNSRTADGSGTGDFISSISGLKSGTSYYIRAYAVNSEGTAYGNQLKFTTKTTGVTFNSSLNYGTVSDIDGNNYKTIPIGLQVWMAENLKTTRLNDGTSIALVPGQPEWMDILTPAYCWFDNNDTLYKSFYGACYNWFAVSTGNLCPAGWHIPSDTEWQQLVDFLGGNSVAGSGLKEVGTNNWISSNKDATNESGFTALPAGQRLSADGTFVGQGTYGGWWSSTEIYSSPLSAAWCRWIDGDSTTVTHSQIYKEDGFSVRCVKD